MSGRNRPRSTWSRLSQMEYASIRCTRSTTCPVPEKEAIYRHLLPSALLETYGIDPDTLCDAQGNRLVTFTCPEGSRMVEVDVRPEVGFSDPLLYLELIDTRLNQIEVMLFSGQRSQRRTF